MISVSVFSVHVYYEAQCPFMVLFSLHYCSLLAKVRMRGINIRTNPYLSPETYDKCFHAVFTSVSRTEILRYDAASLLFVAKEGG